MAASILSMPYSWRCTALIPQFPADHVPNIVLGDVDADGDIDFTDAYLIGTYSVNPSDPTLPPGIGDDIGDDHGDIFSEATQVSLGRLDYGISGQLVIQITFALR